MNNREQLEGLATVLLAIHDMLEASSDPAAKIAGIEAILPSRETVAKAIR